jgi:hypothetical protein
MGANQQMMLGLAARIYATWNPSDKGASVTLSGSNLVATFTSTPAAVRATIGKSAGLWSWELIVGVTVVGPTTGAATSSAALNNYIGSDAAGFGYYGSNGIIYTNGAFGGLNSTYAVGAVITCLLNMESGTLRFKANGTLQTAYFSGLSGTFFPAAGQSGGGTSPSVTLNAGPTLIYPEAGYNQGVYI